MNLDPAQLMASPGAILGLSLALVLIKAAVVVMAAPALKIPRPVALETALLLGPGGEFAYTGTQPKAGLAVGLAFDLLSNIRYQQMVIRLDGDLAGEFATRVTINQIALGGEGNMLTGLVRGAFKNVPLKLNLNVSGPFRALINMSKGFRDPRPVIAPVMPFPIDSPSLEVVTRRIEKETEQTPAPSAPTEQRPPQTTR